MTRVPPLTPDRVRDLTWQWLTAIGERADADWLKQELFHHLTQASLHDAIDEFVWSQAKLLATICPTGTPMPGQWLWLWRQSQHGVNDHRIPVRVRQVLGATVAHA